MSIKTALVITCSWSIINCILTEKAERCMPLFMCPTFCMKVKDGCYVCNCGSFLGYMKNSAEETVRVSNQQSPQTGSQLSSFTSGYIGKDENPTQTGTGSGFMDYRTMFESKVNPHKDNVPSSRPYSTEQLLRYSNSRQDFSHFGQSSQSMPGMNCESVSRDCPASCWSSDIYTGCIHCSCDVFEHKTSTAIPAPTNSTSPDVNRTTTPVLKKSTAVRNRSVSNDQQDGIHTTVPYKMPTLLPTQLVQEALTPISLDSRGHGQGQGQSKDNQTRAMKVPTLPPAEYQQVETINPELVTQIADVTAMVQQTTSAKNIDIKTVQTSSSLEENQQPVAIYGGNHHLQDTTNKVDTETEVDETPKPAFSKDFLMHFDDLNKTTKSTNHTVVGESQGSQHSSSIQVGSHNGYQAVLNTGRQVITSSMSVAGLAGMPTKYRPIFGLPGITSTSRPVFGLPGITTTSGPVFGLPEIQTTSFPKLGQQGILTKEQGHFHDVLSGFLDNEIGESTDQTSENKGGLFDNEINDLTDAKVEGTDDMYSGFSGGFFGNVMDGATSLQDISQNGGTVTDNSYPSPSHFQDPRQRNVD